MDSGCGRPCLEPAAALPYRRTTGRIVLPASVVCQIPTCPGQIHPLRVERRVIR
jgi:hypothetical protein